MENVFDKQRRVIYYELKQIGLEEQECHAEADIILEHVTNLNRTQQITSNLNHFKSDWLQEITRIITSRRKRKPLAYCLGQVEFAGLKFRIVPGILIPRTDTETLVQVIVDRIHTSTSSKNTGRCDRPASKRRYPSECRGEIYPPVRSDVSVESLRPLEATVSDEAVGARANAPARPIHIADIGVGCGAIALALLKHLPNCTVWACDISDLAIHCALGNARRHNVHERLTLVHGDWKKVLPNDFDIIVSNPPYLPLSAQEDLQPEIAFEPKSALFDGSEDGLTFYRQFAEKLPDHFPKNDFSSFAAFEIGDKQEQSVIDIFTQAGWQNLQIEHDTNNLARVLLASPPPEH